MVDSVSRNVHLTEWDKFSQIKPDGIYLTTTELEQLLPGATTALGILYLGKPSEKLPTDAVNQRWFQLVGQNISRLANSILLSLLSLQSIGDRLPSLAHLW